MPHTRTPVIIHHVLADHSITFSRPGSRVVRASRGHLIVRLKAVGPHGVVGVNGLDLDALAIGELVDHIDTTPREVAA